MGLGSAYNSVASSFDPHRGLPGGVAKAVREAVLAALHFTRRPRLLDLGAGTGRFGRTFACAGDDYCGVDLSFGMLRQFKREAEEQDGRVPRLVQADGEHLPFTDATFDAVMLMQVVGAAHDWPQLLCEARRVLRSPGALVVGHTVMPDNGLDEQMKRMLASSLGDMGVASYHINLGRDVRGRLELLADGEERVVAAAWDAERTPRAFIARQPTGARFSALTGAVKDAALRQLSARAAETFGSLDTVFRERHHFELRIFTFNKKVGG